MRAGWYDDPDDPTALRFWDGTSWSQATARRPDDDSPSPSPSPSTPSPPARPSPSQSGPPPPPPGPGSSPGPEPSPPSQPPPPGPGSSPGSPPPPPSPGSSGGELEVSWSEIWEEVKTVGTERLPPQVTHSTASFVGACVVAALLLGGCLVAVNRALNPPSTRAELCAAYREVVAEWFTFDPSDGFFDRRAFNALDDLADVAKRYPDDPAVEDDGRRLADLHDGDGGFIVTVSAASVDRASRNIGAECR